MEVRKAGVVVARWSVKVVLACRRPFLMMHWQVPVISGIPRVATEATGVNAQSRLSVLLKLSSIPSLQN